MRTSGIAAIPHDESERLHVLRSYDQLDTAPEPCLDELTEFACAIFNVPEAQVNFVDADRQFIKANRLPLRNRNVPRADAFCPHTILQNDCFVVLDATRERRFERNPLVAAEGGIRFYAGFPLLVKNGSRIGAFCLVSPEPRPSFSPQEMVVLSRLAREAVLDLEDSTLRRKNARRGEGAADSPDTADIALENHTGLLLLDQDLATLYANPAGRGLLDEALDAKNSEPHSLWSVIAHAREHGECTDMQVRVGHRVFDVQVWPIGNRFAVVLRKTMRLAPSAFRPLEAQEKQEQFRLLVHDTAPLFWTLNPDNPSEADLYDWLQFTGRSFADFCADPDGMSIHPDDQPRVRDLMARASRTGTPFAFDLRVRRFDGIYRWLHAQARPRFHLDGSIQSWVGVHTDVTDNYALQDALRESHERFELATLAATEGVWDFKCATREMYYSAHLRRLLGFPENGPPLSVDAWVERIYPDDLVRVQHQWQQMQTSAAERFETEFRCRVASGEWQWLRVRAVCLKDPDGKLQRVTGTASDISAQRLTDPLTGLHNRSSLLDQILWRIQKAGEFPRNFALYFLDLDSFKQINDSLGHACGDAVLVEVAKRIRSTLAHDNACLVARIGGDEFVVLVNDLETEADALSYGALLLQLLNAPLQLAHPIRVCASVGIAFGTPGKYTTAEEMLEEADLAMYNAKSRGKGSVDLFTPEMREAVVARLGVEQDLRTALAEKQFELKYQPKVKIPSGEIVGVEALLRWKHPERGYVSPADFIPIAEETRLIIPIGDWVVEKVLSQLKKWQCESLLPEGFTVALNVSAHQINGRNFAQALLGRCTEVGIDPRSLCLEITEGVMMGDAAAINMELQRIVRAGFELDLDDFGTGFSSLRYLQRFSFGSVKIDRSFVANMCRDLRSRSLVQTIVDLSRSLHMGVVAEGVETEEQAAALQAMGCTRAQGFLYSAAVSAAEIESVWLNKAARAVIPSQEVWQQCA